MNCISFRTHAAHHGSRITDPQKFGVVKATAGVVRTGGKNVASSVTNVQIMPCD